MKSEHAIFVERSTCICCESKKLEVLSSGSFEDQPLKTFIQQDPWGVSPYDYIKQQKWSYVKCSQCRQAFHRTVLSPEWMEICYSEWVSHEAIQEFTKDRNTPSLRFEKTRRSMLHVLRLEMLTRQLRGNKELKLLDFGCGYGEFVSLCRSFGINAIGIDFSPDKIEIGTPNIFSNIEQYMSATSGEPEFQVVTLFEVLEHLADPMQTLVELTKLMVKGGILVLETPDCTGVSTIITPNDYRLIHPLSHINGFTPDSLARMAKTAGFEPIAKPEIQATGNQLKAFKTEIKRLVKPFMKPTTQQYFRLKQASI